MATALSPIPVLAADLTEPDKTTHIQASTGLSMISYGAFRAASYGKISSSLLSIGVTLAIGHLKEESDPFYDRDDMKANLVGASLGIIIPLSFQF